MEILHKECYVAFLDILGFKKICLEMSSEDVLKIFLDIKQTGEKQKEKYRGFGCDAADVQILHDNLYFHIMSDSIVFAIERDLKGSYDFLLSCCKTIQRNLLFNHKILLRGGVSKGCFYGNQEIMFGKGLINAYNIEKTAKVPCVCVDKKITDDPQNKGLRPIEYAFDILSRDEGKNIFIKYIEAEDYLDSHKRKLVSEKIVEGFDLIKEESDKRKREKLEEKYNWLNDYHIKLLDEYDNLVEFMQ